MKAFRMKHVPTGMYYCPARDIRVQTWENGVETKTTIYTKSNLSKKGKVYPFWPTFKYIGDNFYNHFIPIISTSGNYGGWQPRGYKDKMSPFIETEWEIEEIG